MEKVDSQGKPVKDVKFNNYQLVDSQKATIFDKIFGTKYRTSKVGQEQKTSDKCFCVIFDSYYKSLLSGRKTRH